MAAFMDLSGQKFGRWAVLMRAENQGTKAAWHVRCDCGKERVVKGATLLGGHSRSCGCIGAKAAAARAVARNTTHGKSHLRAYASYKNALDRCTNPENKNFHYYGGRGVKFLFTSVQQFLDELGERPLGMTLERINNATGHYEPGNVEWRGRLPQANNRRKNRPLTAFGVTHNLSTWARMLNINHGTLWERLEKMPVEKALSNPPTRLGLWIMVPVPASETYSATDSWEWKLYVPHSDV